MHTTMYRIFLYDTASKVCLQFNVYNIVFIMCLQYSFYNDNTIRKQGNLKEDENLHCQSVKILPRICHGLVANGFGDNGSSLFCLAETTILSRRTFED